MIHASDIALNVRQLIWWGDVKPDFEDAVYDVVNLLSLTDEQKAHLYAFIVESGANEDTPVHKLEELVKFAMKKAKIQ